MLYGSRVSGRLVPIADLSALSKPGEVFEIHIETDGIPDEQMVIQQLLTLEQQFEDLRVLYIETDGTNIKMEVTDIGPSGWTFAGIVTAIPTVLILIGVTIGAIFLWQIVTTAHPVLLLLVGLGGIMLFLSVAGIWEKIPKPIQIRTKAEETKSEIKDVVKRQKGIYTQERLALKTTLTDIREDSLPRVEKEIKVLEEKKVKAKDEKKRFMEGSELRQLYKERKELKETQREATKRLGEIAKKFETLAELGD